MANLDTASKRISSVGIMLVSILAVPLPDATIDAGDRADIAWSYSGIAAVGVVADPIICLLEPETLCIPTFRHEWLRVPAHQPETLRVPVFPPETLRC